MKIQACNQTNFGMAKLGENLRDLVQGAKVDCKDGYDLIHYKKSVKFLEKLPDDITIDTYREPNPSIFGAFFGHGREIVTFNNALKFRVIHSKNGANMSCLERVTSVCDAIQRGMDKLCSTDKDALQNMLKRNHDILDT